MYYVYLLVMRVDILDLWSSHLFRRPPRRRPWRPVKAAPRRVQWNSIHFFAFKDINLSKRRSSFCCCASLAIFHIHTHTHRHSITSYMSCCEYASKENTYTAHKYGKHTHFSDEQFHSFKFLTKRDAFILAMHDMSGSCHIKAHRICSNIATAVTSSAILFEATFHYCRWSW